MTTIRRLVPWTALPLALAASLTAGACTNIVQQSDGSFLASMGERRIVIPASVATSVGDALSEHGNDPQGLKSAMQAIVSESAGGAGDVLLAAAIAELAVCSSNGGSEVVAAIVDGTMQGNPSVTTEMALSAVAAATPVAPRPKSQDAQDTHNTRSTVGGTDDVSPV